MRINIGDRLRWYDKQSLDVTILDKEGNVWMVGDIDPGFTKKESVFNAYMYCPDKVVRYFRAWGYSIRRAGKESYRRTV